MHVLYEATLVVARESFAMLREALDGLPDEAMDWTPVEGTNALGVLTMHSITSTRFWIRAGIGDDVSFDEYRTQERAAAFESKGKDASSLVAAIDQCVQELERILQGADPAAVEATRWPDDPSMTKTGARCLVHAIGHLREHVGQAQLTRDLWRAQQR